MLTILISSYLHDFFVQSSLISKVRFSDFPWDLTDGVSCSVSPWTWLADTTVLERRLFRHRLKWKATRLIMISGSTSHKLSLQKRGTHTFPYSCCPTFVRPNCQGISRVGADCHVAAHTDQQLTLPRIALEMRPRFRKPIVKLSFRTRRGVHGSSQELPPLSVTEIMRTLWLWVAKETSLAFACPRTAISVLLSASERHSTWVRVLVHLHRFGKLYRH